MRRGSFIQRATLSRYIARRVLKAISLAFLIVVSIIILVDFVEGSRSLDSEISSSELVILTLFKAPTLIEETIPFIVLFGVMGALYGLNRSSELVVMRASGLSVWRFLSPVIILTGLLGLAWALLFNPFASDFMSRHDSLQESLIGVSETQTRNVWLREGDSLTQTVIRAEGIDFIGRKLVNATFYQMDVEADQRTVFARRYDTPEAVLTPQGYWQLSDVIENAPGEVTRRTANISLPTDITTRQFQEVGQKSSAPPFWSLPGAIKNSELAGFSALFLKMRFNKLMALPILLIAMSVIAAGVSLRLARQGGTFKLLVTGAAIGFLVYFIDSIVATFGEVGLIPIVLAAWSVPLLALLMGVIYLLTIEDG